MRAQKTPKATALPKRKWRTVSVQEMFRVLGEPRRFAVFDYLIRHKNVSVHEAATFLSLTPAAACQHLKVLEEHKVVVHVREGRDVCYRLNFTNPIVHTLRRTFFNIRTL